MAQEKFPKRVSLTKIYVVSDISSVYSTTNSLLVSYMKMQLVILWDQVYYIKHVRFIYLKEESFNSKKFLFPIPPRLTCKYCVS